MVLLISSIGAVRSSPTCNSFPKIFGGSSSDTILYQIDVFNDYLGLAGFTRVSSLTGISGDIPYLALTSISIGSNYYWAKVLSSKTWTSFYGV